MSANLALKNPPTNIKHEAFCKMYLSFGMPYYGNATACYQKIYGQKNYQVATASAKQLLNNPKIMARLNDLLSEQGFNDVAVDKKHNFLIHQYKDFNVSLKAIQEYNKLKKRVDNSIQIVMPKPIMDLEDDEVIHKIDKSKAKDV